jgi:iron complex transport system substrate-binding protein
VRVARPRIISLLPSATEIAVAVGHGPGLVGRSHECDFPPFVARLPVCTATKLQRGLTSRQIEDRVQEIVRQGLSVYEVDTELLKALKPDVILTQSQCAVCAVTPGDLEESLASWVGALPTLISLAPDSLSDVWTDLIRVGAVMGASTAAEQAVKALQARLEALRAWTSSRGWRPRVASVEWIDPLMAAGNWVPELIDVAGGEPLFAVAGQHSPWLEWDAFAAADPDIIIMMPCGNSIAQTIGDFDALAARPGWADLTAVRTDRVYAADGHHYFNRPGPRLVESAEIVAEVIDDALNGSVAPSDRWQRIRGSSRARAAQVG